MTRILTAGAVLFALSMWNPEAAADSVCAQIEDREVRLKCYDAEYRATPATDDTAATDAPGKRESRTSSESRVAVPVRERKTAKPGKPPKVSGFPHRVVSITTSGTDRKLVYVLDNGERWVQTKTQDATIRENDAVRIKESMTGRNQITTRRGARAWVKKLR